eukprot:gene22220-30461_t
MNVKACVILTALAEKKVWIFGKNSTTASIIRRPCKIVVRDNIRGYLNWMQEWFQATAKSKCSKTVTITENQGELRTADIVLYHAPTHHTGAVTDSRSLKSTCINALISMEQPKYATVLNQHGYLQEHFDLILTYSLSPIYPMTTVPNLPITYFPLNILSVNSVLHKPRPFNEKNGFGTGVAVALFASNCKAAGATVRYAFLEELMRYIKVHSYGKCLHNFEEPSMKDDPTWPPIAQRRARKVKVLSRYKFYLAFENAPVEDYVSEKVFEGLFAGTVPVYKGASTIHKFMPANDSYIDANSLSPRQLATKLTELSQSEIEYAKFFAFKDRPLSESFKDIALMSYTHPNVLCRLCDYVSS